MVKKDTGADLDMDHIDFNDKAVLIPSGPGRTDGVFQLESGGMKNFMKELKPQNLEDIIAGISLYRPGPWISFPNTSAEKQRGQHHLSLPAAGAYPGAHLWLHRLSGAGDADRAGSGRLYQHAI